MAEGAQKDKSGKNGCVMTGLLAAVLALVVVYFVNSGPTKNPKPATVVPLETGNVAHDRLSSLSDSAKALFLGKVAGEGCVGTEPFFMGMNKERGAFWSVRCANGSSYQVRINPDSVGSTDVISCSLLKSVANVKCFVRFEDQ